MKTFFATLLLGLLFHFTVAGKASVASAPAATLNVREIRYIARLAEDEARFSVSFDAEAAGKGENSLKILEGDVAVLPAKLPDSLKMFRDGNSYFLVAPRAGRYKFNLEVVAKIQRDEPWNRVSFVGPPATIASVLAQAAGTNTEVQLLNGTLLEAFQTNGVSGVQGFLGADQTVSLRWQGKITAVARKALLTADSDIAALVTPTVVKYTSKFHYDIVQGSVVQLALALPAAQALTRLEGAQIRDWHTSIERGRQTLTVEFIKPLENACDLTLHSEQSVEISNPVIGPSAALSPNGGEGKGEGVSPNILLTPPQPLGVDRESGALTISAEDTLVETAAVAGLRQVNAPENAVAAYRFNARPFTLALKLKRIEPVVTLADRVTARLEESRLVVAHCLALNVEKSGIYALELSPAPGFTVADVRGAGIEDWNVVDGKLSVNFSARVLGQRQVDVQLERALKTFPEQVGIAPLRVAGAAKETSQIGVAAVPGIRLKTASISGLREVPANVLPSRSDEILAYTAEQSDWQLAIACEKLAARVVADVFNLVTIGDGVVGGSATIRYGLVNQGVQEFKVRVPAGFKNVEFTGPNIRRKECADGVWIIGLQDKVWGAYTLVVTYDYQFDSRGARLPIGGIHAVDVERESGSIAVTTAASLQLDAQTPVDSLRRVDESELSAADRSLVTRAVVLAWQYNGWSRQGAAAADGQYDLAVDVKRYAEERVLEAVADRTQITSVLTESGEMLTQASFMVKNNEKQFQRFQLPNDARLWGCYVNGQPAKPSRDGDWVLVSLPRDANRDQAFAVDIMYAQTNGGLAATFGKNLELNAPRTDVPNTYAEWQIFVPPSLRLSDFGGSMNVTQGTTYELFDAWEKFLAFYGQVLREAGAGILVIGLLALLVLALVISAVRRGWNGVITLLGVFAIIAVLGAMLLPALAAAKRKAQTINSVNNLKQIGLAVRIFSGDNGDRLPVSFEEMKNELGTDKVTYDPATGQRYTYLGGGMSLNNLQPDSVLAYSTPDEKGRCAVLFADGSVEQAGAQRFAQLSQRGLVQVVAPQELAVKQREVLGRAQLVGNFPALAAAPPVQSEGLFVQAGAGRTDSGALTIATNAWAAAAAVPAPVAAGIRSIRIELPQTGQPFLFTKVLNVHGEPLSIRAHVLPMRTFQFIQMAWQSVAFLLGLFVWWMQWHRPRRNSFVLTLALACVIGSVASLLIQWRALHDALIIGFPMAVVAFFAFLVWKYWPRRAKTEAAPEAPSIEPSAPDSGLPPVLASVALVLALSLVSAVAADPEIRGVQSAMNAPSLVVANYSGSVNDRVALVDANLRFSGVKAGAVVPLFGDDVTAQQFIVKNSSATLVRNGSSLSVRFDRDGNAELQVRLLAKVSGDVTKRRLAFAIPPALASRVALTLEQAEADVDFPAAVSLKRTLAKDQTFVEAVVGSADRVELLWTPRVKRAEEVAATVFCRNAALVTFGGGVVNTRATLDYQITQGELRQARVQLPVGQRLLRVEGKEIRTWEIKTVNGAQTLVVDLLKGVSLNWRLSLETEKILGALPVTETAVIPHALDVKRENGLIALRGAEELTLAIDAASGLERVDVEEFARATAEKSANLSCAFRFVAPDFALRVRAEAVQPQIEAVVRNHFRVGAGQVLLSATIDYTIKRVGVFTLRVALPDDWRIERVNGNGIQQWKEQTDGLPRRGAADAGGRVLEVTLKDRTSGSYTLALRLERSFKELPKSLVIAGVQPLDTAKLIGFVTVSADAGVAVKTGAFDGLTEIPASLAMDSPTSGAGNLLAFKFISTQPKAWPEWNLTLATETVAAWVRAEVVNSFTLDETLVSGRALVRYDIANAPVKELRVRVPIGFRNVDINGANIRSKDQIVDGTNSIWRVELQSALRGSYSLAVTWDEPRPEKTNILELAGVSAGNVERETGYFAVSAKSPLQVGELNATDLQRVDAADLPDWSGVAGSTVTLAYHYARPGARLALDVRRFNDAAVLEALVDNATFTSVVAADGQMMTELSLSVRNNGRQFLEVELPADAKVWSAFVAGQPVRPSVRGGKYLLPIESAGANDAISVELTYVGTNHFPKARGEIGFVSPKFDVPLKNARWEVYLPPDYDYQDLRQGTMTRETSLKAEPLSLSYSFLDYSRMEQASKASAKVEMERDVSVARQQLASGKIREATANWNRAKSKAGGETGAEMKKLNDELKSAQASNLIMAQNAFYLRNNGQELQVGDADKGVLINAAPILNDTAAAGEQWAKLQQAQEIVTARIQPLHVNLPVRGLRLAFAQVLQTEGGKPMTFRLAATNTKTVHWPLRLAGGAAAFLVLWGMVAMFSRVTRRAV
jgi:type II secretory pathway pseudopilin PulG